MYSLIVYISHVIDFCVFLSLNCPDQENLFRLHLYSERQKVNYIGLSFKI